MIKDEVLLEGSLLLKEKHYLATVLVKVTESLDLTWTKEHK